MPVIYDRLLCNRCPQLKFARSQFDYILIFCTYKLWMWSNCPFPVYSSVGVERDETSLQCLSFRCWFTARKSVVRVPWLPTGPYKCILTAYLVFKYKKMTISTREKGSKNEIENLFYVLRTSDLNGNLRQSRLISYYTLLYIRLNTKLNANYEIL